jgi:DNA-directed RNA polymerase subunit RPC12/RpoP
MNRGRNSVPSDCLKLQEIEMIQLHPKPTVEYTCAKCGTVNKPNDWLIPGMRNLAEVSCQSCGIKYYADLPSGHGLTYPMYLFPESGEVHDIYGVDWFSTWLRESYLNRISQPIGFTVKEFHPVRKPILLNCLDNLYAHCLYKLLNAQYYIDHCPDYDLIVMIQPFLTWMIPEGVAQVWIVDLPLRKGTEWNDWLAAEIKNRISQYSECKLSMALSHPHPDDVNIERFVKVQPFNIDSWLETSAAPVITYIWRDDRIWSNHNSMSFLERRSVATIDQQKTNVISLARFLRKEFLNADFAVAGVGHCKDLGENILNLTFEKLDESAERKLCERYARSHIAIGVHGSNMSLPSALAGTVIELLGNDRYGNIVQDLLINESDARSALVRYRMMPLNSSPEEIAAAASSLLHKIPRIFLNFRRPWVDHKSIQAEPQSVARKFREIPRKE